MMVFGALSGDDWVKIIGSIGSAAVAVVGAFAAYMVSANRKAVAATAAAVEANEKAVQVSADLASDLKTNHGKRPGEYLEMVGEVRVDIAVINSKLDRVVEILAQHTTQDAENFYALRQILSGKADK